MTINPILRGLIGGTFAPPSPQKALNKRKHPRYARAAHDRFGLAAQAATAAIAGAGARVRAFQFQGSSSSTLLIGWSGSLASTSASQARGSTSLSLQVVISEYTAAARRPPSSDATS